MNARTEPLWMVFGAAGVAVSAFGVGLFGLFPLVLLSLLVMGTSDGISIVAENGIMQRRTPDAVRSRTMAALEAVLSLGLAVAYLAAGPVLRLVGAADRLRDRRRVRPRCDLRPPPARPPPGRRG